MLGQGDRRLVPSTAARSRIVAAGGESNHYGQVPRSSDPARKRQEASESAPSERRIPRYRSLVLHWIHRAFRHPARAAVAPLPAAKSGQVGITFAGHATALVRYESLTIACDPMLGDWCRGIHREVHAGLSPAELGDVDLVLISHNSPDHLHRPTLAALPRTATIVVPPRTGHRVSDLGFARVVELGIGQSLEHRGVDVATAAARHGSARRPACSYMIRGDGPSVYFCGASGYFSGFAEIGRRHRPDVALLPIGGYSPSSFRERNMSPADAVRAFEDLMARVMVPIRFGAFVLSYELIHDPERWLAELRSARNLEGHILLLESGESGLLELPQDAEAEAGSRAPSALTENGRVEVEVGLEASGAIPRDDPPAASAGADDTPVEPVEASDPAEPGAADEQEAHLQEPPDETIAAS